MQDIARRADVALGTVIHHFPTAEDLAQAAIAHIADTLIFPTQEIFAGSRTVSERVERLVRELFQFYERSGLWYQVYDREKDRVEALALAEARFQQDLEALVKTALGALSNNERAVSVVIALIDGSVFAALRRRGLPVNTGADLVIELLLPFDNNLTLI